MVKQEWLPIRSWKEVQSNHLHSIVKKKRLKDEKFEKEYPEVRSDFYLIFLIILWLISLGINRLESLLRNKGAGVFRVGQIRK